MAQDINSWADFKKTLKQLEMPAVQEKFSNIIIDTADQAYIFCQKYIAKKYGEDDIEEIGYGKLLPLNSVNY